MELQGHFSTVSRSLGQGAVSARFYPYAELKHTWRATGRAIEFRISDYVDGSPDEILESLARYLVHRASGTRCPRENADPYLRYARSPELWARNRDLYLSRAKSLSLDPIGRVRDLDAVFTYVNSFYFRDELQYPTLAWSNESPRTRLGFYFSPLNMLVANKVLDSERVPRYVLEFVMYHELLHHAMSGNAPVRRRVHHDRAFRDRERLFSHYEDAEQWLRKLVRESRRR